LARYTLVSDKILQQLLRARGLLLGPRGQYLLNRMGRRPSHGTTLTVVATWLLERGWANVLTAAVGCIALDRSGSSKW